MKGFLHTADIHIGESRTLGPDYLERHKKILEQIINHATISKMMLVIAGDLFHWKKTTLEERYLADWFLCTLERNKIHTILIAGNHDHQYGEVTSLDGYAQFPFSFVRVIPWEPTNVIIDNIGFICIPWRSYGEDDIKNIVTVKKSQLPETVKHKIVVMHECVRNAKYDNGILALKGMNLPVISDIDYWALGDIHTFQRTTLDTAFYSGAPLQFKFADARTKGVLKVDLKKPREPAFIKTLFKEMIIVDSMKDVSDDAFYFVKGDVDTMVEASKNANVIRTEWSKLEHQAILLPTVGMTDGLTEILASKGCDEEAQREALEFVNKILGAA